MTARDARMLSRSPHGSHRIAILALIATLVPSIGRAQATTPQNQADQPPPPQFKETIEVVGATPIHGLGIQRNKIPKQRAGGDGRRPGADTGHPFWRTIEYRVRERPRE